MKVPKRIRKLVENLKVVQDQIKELDAYKQNLATQIIEWADEKGIDKFSSGDYSVNVIRPVEDVFDADGLAKALKNYPEELFYKRVNRRLLFQLLDYGKIPREVVAKYWQTRAKNPYVLVKDKADE